VTCAVLELTRRYRNEALQIAALGGDCVREAEGFRDETDVAFGEPHFRNTFLLKRLVLRRPFRVVDDEDFSRTLARL
jgi:hypothetical protein